MAFFDEADLINGTSGNVIDDMQQAFDAGWDAAMRAMKLVRLGCRCDAG